MIPVQIRVFEKNDTTLDIALTTAAGAAYDLTGATIEMIVKTSPQVADASALKTYSTTAATITVATPSSGELSVLCDADDTQMQTPGRYSYRIDVIVSSRRQTVMFGDFVVVDV